MQTNRKIYKNTHYKKSLLIIPLQNLNQNHHPSTEKRGKNWDKRKRKISAKKIKDAILFTGIGTYAASASPALLLPLRKLKA